VLVAFTLFERPSWCFPQPSDAPDLCETRETSGLLGLSRAAGLAVEIVLLVLLLLDSLTVRLAKSPGRRWLKSPFRVIRVVLLVISLVTSLFIY
jgi:hypothetical protein